MRPFNEMDRFLGRDWVDSTDRLRRVQFLREFIRNSRHRIEQLRDSTPRDVDAIVAERGILEAAEMELQQMESESSFL